MPDEQTWESASTEPTAEPAAPVVETPAVEPVADPPAETPTLETTEPQLPVEPEVVRDSESQPEPEPTIEVKDEDVEEGDTPEILGLPSGSSSRKWARRQFHDAAPIRVFDDLDKPIQSFGDELYKRSESRYFEHVDDIAKYHADYIAQKLFGAKSADEIKARLQTPNEPAQPATIQTASLPTDEELNSLTNEQLAQRFQEAQTVAAAEREKQLRAEFDSKFNELKSQLDAATNEQTTQKQQAFNAKVSEETNKLYDTVWTSVVDGGIRESGLEVKPDDPPKIANLKRAAARILKSETEPTFDRDDSNKKLVAQVMGFARRGEFQNAWREQDNLTVRARTAFAAVKDSPEVKEIMAEIEAYANQSKATSRAANPAPPAPGSSTGVTIKAPTNWDEAAA